MGERIGVSRDLLITPSDSSGRSMSLPFLNTAPERTGGTRWGALTASLAKHGGEGGLDRYLESRGFSVG